MYLPPHGPFVYACTYVHTNVRSFAYICLYVCVYTLGEEMVELEHLEGQLRTLMDKFKHQRRELKQTKDDTKVWREEGREEVRGESGKERRGKHGL